MNIPIGHAPRTICSAIVLLLLIVGESKAQFNNLGINSEWNKGSLVLEDNSSLTGLIQFNDKLGMIKFRKDAKSQEESFVETSILAMKFYDEGSGKWRNFAVFNLVDEESGWQGGLLFEVLMEFGNFALLTRLDKVNVSTRDRRDSFGNYYTARVGHEQFEYLCLVNEAGEANLALAVNEFEKDKWSIASKLKPILKKDALKKYLAADWDKFQELVKTHDLNLKLREDFIRAFELYAEVNEKRL